MDKLEALGITPVMISVDDIDGIVKTQETYEVPFPLLSDPDVKVHTAFKVVNDLGDAGTQRLLEFGIDVERWSKRKHHKIAVPSIFLIDREGVVRFAHAAHDYKTRPDTDALLAVLEENVKSRK